jgi:chromosome segregation ATPase
LQDQLEDVS